MSLTLNSMSIPLFAGHKEQFRGQFSANSQDLLHNGSQSAGIKTQALRNGTKSVPRSSFPRELSVCLSLLG